jgi:SMC interacting uncharacterized protein involved in chromosome segregation
MKDTLVKYANELKAKLESKDIPIKHVNHPNEYREFLTRELKAVTAKLDAAKLDGVKK